VRFITKVKSDSEHVEIMGLC